MPTTYMKPTPEEIREALSYDNPSAKEVDIINSILNIYKQYYHDGRFRYFDKFLSYQNKRQQLSENTKTNAIIFVKLFNLAEELFQSPVQVEMKSWEFFVDQFADMSKELNLRVSQYLPKMAKYTINNDMLNIFISLCVRLELAILPNQIKNNYLQLQTDKRLPDFDQCLVTFMKTPDYSTMKKCIENATRYTSTKINFVIAISQIGNSTTEYFATIYRVRPIRKILAPESSLRQIVAKFVYS